ncbi:hypothetical protein L21SP3_01399 [Sedimentisphaera cyanobacteriorum]|uniref:YgjP-like metallopeptidase domain-containing protein n=1 Tax=Sedimentisphaera cyanobacteriorum TaxID=1940790 RepID=A0A1Q2HQH3_9BACT|nr:M48 family metallopeptidase [Sedimentisphaera cyanobacteriorum]AQQ09591.1 hypothetical protein L21SP3_01399 [Sedimentisphaera cyanobacteriorum]
MMDFIEKVEGIEVRVVTSPRAKHLRLTVSQSGARLSVPLGVSGRRAIEFLNTKKDWLSKSFTKVEKRKENLSSRLKDLPKLDLYQQQEKLFSRAQQLASRFGFEYSKITFRCQKTRWGSCSSKNSISLNINMVLLPEYLQDYLILHELAHTKVKSHCKKFWHLLDGCCGQRSAKALDKELNSYSIIFTPEQIWQLHKSSDKPNIFPEAE